MKEITKNVKGYEGIYTISNFGKVTSLARVDSAGHELKQRVLVNWVHKSYEYVSLCKNWIVKKFLVHRLVAQYFVPNTDNKAEVNHIDGVKSNNAYSNLEWTTHAENMRHAGKSGLMKPYDRRGEKHMSNKLNEKQVRVIKHLLKTIKTKMTHVKIAKIFNVSTSTINLISSGHSWKHVKIN